MDKLKIKFALQEMNDDILKIVDKFLRTDLISFKDLRWWWDPDRREFNNKKEADALLILLINEKCLVRAKKVYGRGLKGYKKTEEFIELLNEIDRIESLLRINNEKL